MIPFIPFLLIFLGVFLIAIFARARVEMVLDPERKEKFSGKMSGSEAARRMLDEAGALGVEVVERDSAAGSFYDMIGRRLVLAPQNFRGQSVAAVGVALHEAGHALQHHDEYGPLQMRLSAIRMSQVLGGIVFFVPLILGLVTPMPIRFAILIVAISWGALMIFNLATMSVEFDASARARKWMEKARLSRGRDESKRLRRVMSAASLTHLAVLVRSPLYLLYHLLPTGGLKR